jgi:membrane protein DedA with SNARE-associated domain
VGVIEFLVELILALVSAFGYVGIFLAVVIESIIVPIPSELILPFAGYLAYTGEFNLWILLVVVTLGSVVASVIAYAIGYYGGLPFLRKYGKYMFISEEHLVNAEKWFDVHGTKAVLFGKFIPGIRSIISLPAGIARMNIWKFIIYSAVGSIPWNAGLVFLGYVLGPEYSKITEYSEVIDWIGLTALLLVLGYIIYKIKKKSKK